VHTFVYGEKISGWNIGAVTEGEAPLEHSAIAAENNRITPKTALVGYAYTYMPWWFGVR